MVASMMAARSYITETKFVASNPAAISPAVSPPDARDAEAEQQDGERPHGLGHEPRLPQADAERPEAGVLEAGQHGRDVHRVPAVALDLPLARQRAVPRVVDPCTLVVPDDADRREPGRVGQRERQPQRHGEQHESPPARPRSATRTVPVVRERSWQVPSLPDEVGARCRPPAGSRRRATPGAPAGARTTWRNPRPRPASRAAGARPPPVATSSVRPAGRRRRTRHPVVEPDQQRAAPEEPRGALAVRLDQRARRESQHEHPIGGAVSARSRSPSCHVASAENLSVGAGRRTSTGTGRGWFVRARGRDRRRTGGPLVELVHANDADGEQQEQRGPRERPQRAPRGRARDARRERERRCRLHEVLRQLAAAVHRDRQAGRRNPRRRDGQARIGGSTGAAAPRTRRRRRTTARRPAHA